MADMDHHVQVPAMIGGFGNRYRLIIMTTMDHHARVYGDHRGHPSTIVDIHTSTDGGIRAS